MAMQRVLLEFEQSIDQPFAMHEAVLASTSDAEDVSRAFLRDLPGIGVELDPDAAPVPMFVRPAPVERLQDSDLILAAVADDSSDRFASEMAAAAAIPEHEPDLSATSVVIPAEVSRSAFDELVARAGVTVWPNSEMTLIDDEVLWAGPSALGGVDCRPFRAGVEIDVIRANLGVGAIWQDGYRGQNIVVGIIDEGVNGQAYPVIGGFSRPTSARQPGTAPVTSHGSMCAADVLVAAPLARIYDYPFLGVPNSGGALQMFQAVLDQRRRDGTPHLTNNSYGFVGVPDRATNPNHEVHNLQHPVHRKVREVVLAGIPCFFAAGNCGANCPSGACHPSGIGPGRSIHASNSLTEVITVAAVNSQHERIGYSSQGPGMFDPRKPDVACYSHFFANFGPGRPGGLAQPFDNGTSAATPVAAGVAAALLSAFPSLSPAALKAVLIGTATDLGAVVGWDGDHGAGVINLAAAYNALKQPCEVAVLGQDVVRALRAGGPRTE